MTVVSTVITTVITVSKTYTRKEMAYLVGCSVPTVDRDITHLNLAPTIGDRGSKLYSDRDFNLITQLRNHCQNPSNTRDSFVPNTEAEVVIDETVVSRVRGDLGHRDLPKVTKLDRPKSSLATYGPRLKKQDLLQNSIDLGLSQDPLFDLEMLQRICDRHWLMPTSRLAPLLGISAKYLNSKKQYNYCGFTVVKTDYVTDISRASGLPKPRVLSNKALWLVEKNR